jgi:polar amino acid transport system substrate-binding protein
LRARLVGVALVAGLCAACVPEEEAIDLSRSFPPDTLMGAIQERGEIVIGVRGAAAPLGAIDRASGRARGLSGRLGDYLARTMGVEARYVSGSSAELIDMVEGGRADLGFVTSPLTEKAVRSHSFADPYYIGHQRLLVPAGVGGVMKGVGGVMKGVEGLSDLRGSTVCSLAPGTTGVALDRLVEGVKVLETENVGRCVRWLRRGRVRAATGIDSSLVTVKLELRKSEGPKRWKVVGAQLNTVGLAPVVPPGLPAYRDYVGAVLRRAIQEGVWARAYEDLLAPHLGPKEPPALTAEEAAALYPTATTARGTAP